VAHGRGTGPDGKAPLLQAFDGWLIKHPEAAMRITVLAMYALYLCAPRLKEYAFFEVALYAAVLVVELICFWLLLPREPSGESAPQEM
jgi:hypothetical protein